MLIRLGDRLQVDPWDDIYQDAKDTVEKEFRERLEEPSTGYQNVCLYHICKGHGEKIHNQAWEYTLGFLAAEKSGVSELVKNCKDFIKEIYPTMTPHVKVYLEKYNFYEPEAKRTPIGPIT